MARVLGILTNDPSLLRCQAARLEPSITFPEDEVLGLGSFDDTDVLLARRPAGVGARKLPALVEGIQSPALLAMSRMEAIYQEENVHPIKYRSWLFALDAEPETLAKAREAMEASLPLFLSRSLQTVTSRERVFFLFLRELYEKNQLDDPNLEAAEAARSLARALRAVDELLAQSGETRPVELAALATNGRVLVGARRGRPLAYLLGEGSGACSLCGLDERSDDPRVSAHRRARFVALASVPSPRDGFIEIPDRSVVSVSHSLQINVASL